MPSNTGAYDLFLEFNSNKVGFILSKDEAGNKKYWPGLAPVLAQQINTGAFSYQGLPSEIDVPVPSEVWTTAGLVDEDPQITFPRAYHYSQNIDASYGSRLYLSPARNAVLADSGSAILGDPVKFIDSSIGLFMVAGQYIYEYQSGTNEWVEADDASGDGENYTDIIEMDGVLYACRGQGADYKYSTNGTDWTAFTDSDNNFNYFAVRGISSGQAVLWGVKADGTLKNTTDGQNGGVAWSAADAVGHTSETVRGMLEANDDIYVFKNEGIYRYTGSATEDVWLGGKQMQRATNGKNPFLWYDLKIYVPYGDKLLQFDPSQTDGISLAFVFPQFDGSEELNGSITAISGDADWLYVSLKNSAGNTYTLRGNPYKHEGHAAEHSGSWHTFTYNGGNDCNASIVVGPGVWDDDVTDNPVYVAGYGTAASGWILARSGLRPEDDANYLFYTGTDAKLVGTWNSVGAQSFSKFLNAGRVVAESVTSGRPVIFKYEVDTDLGTETTLVTASSVGSTGANAAGQVEFNRIRGIVTMQTGDASVSPVGVGFVFNTTPNPPRKRVWSFEVLVGDELEGNGGVRSRYSGKELEAFLFNALSEKVTLYDRRNRTFTVKILDLRSLTATPTKQGGDTENVRLTTAQVGT